MNRVARYGLSAMAVVLLLGLLLVGCGVNCEECKLACRDYELCPTEFSRAWPVCVFGCLGLCNVTCIPSDEYQGCTVRADECSATFEQIQVAGIEYCERHPDECAELFGHWAESFIADAQEQVSPVTPIWQSA
jgi:hypothetical protein